MQPTQKRSEAVGRPNMRLVSIKSIAQQAVLALHSVGSLPVRQSTAAINPIRRPLSEFGQERYMASITAACSQRVMRRCLPGVHMALIAQVLQLLHQHRLNVSPFILSYNLKWPCCPRYHRADRGDAGWCHI